jgi:hypothetical protein
MCGPTRVCVFKSRIGLIWKTSVTCNTEKQNWSVEVAGNGSCNAEKRNWSAELVGNGSCNTEKQNWSAELAGN